MDLLKLLEKSLPLNTENIYIGYSGGIDSTVLLYITSKLNLPVIAVHINHGLSSDSQLWEDSCQETCTKLGIKLQSFKINIDTDSGKSIEAMARDGRYEIFESLLSSNDIMLTAQHQSDQAETLLLRLLRGSGPVGLSAMPKQRLLGQGLLIRPWLTVDKSTIVKFAVDNKLQWTEDPSNLENSFDRNFLRNKIIPLLKTRWPALDKTISRSADLCRIYIDDYNESSPTFEINLLNGLELKAASHKIYLWLRGLDVLLPSYLQITKIVAEVAMAKVDAKPQLTWSDGQIRRFKGKLYYLSVPKNLARITQTNTWSGTENLDILGLTLKKTISVGKGFVLDKDAKLEIKFSQGGEIIKPLGSRHSKKLKKLFQEYSIPPWERVSMPLVYSEGNLVQVVGLCVNDLYKAAPEQQGCLIELN